MKLSIKYLESPLFFISAACLIFSYFVYDTDYLTYKSRKVVVLDKLESQGKYNTNFYLIMKDSTGYVFDLNVSPSTYSQTQKGKYYHFKLRDFDFKQNKKSEILSCLGWVAFCAGIIILIANFIFIRLD